MLTGSAVGKAEVRAGVVIALEKAQCGQNLRLGLPLGGGGAAGNRQQARRQYDCQQQG